MQVFLSLHFYNVSFDERTVGTYYNYRNSWILVKLESLCKAKSYRAKGDCGGKD